MQAWFSLLFSYPLFYQQFTIDLYRGWMVNSAASNTALVEATYQMMVPEPKGPELTTLDTSTFFTIAKPKAYIFETFDHSLSTDPRAWLLFAERLKSANNAGLALQVTYSPSRRKVVTSGTWFLISAMSLKALMDH